MSDSAVAEIASTIQSASINRHPSPTHDINPSTTASKHEPIDPATAPPASSSSRPTSSSTTTNAASIPSSALNPPRRPQHGRQPPAALPPLPDLRFEQSYLASLKGTTTAWDVAWVTARDQVLLPLVQGTMWTLFVSGWRHWHKGASIQGTGLGARIRRWWWEINGKTPAGEGGGLRKGDKKLARDVGEFYTAKMGSAGHD